MHGRRQFVAWVVPFSGVTNATLVACYICQARLPTTKRIDRFGSIVLCVVGGRWGWRQVSMSLIPWATHVIQWMVQQDAIPKGGANPYKTILSSDWGLQLDLMKPELLVIAGRTYRGEYVLKSCTHRPSTQGSQEYPISHHVWDYGKLGNRE